MDNETFAELTNAEIYLDGDEYFLRLEYDYENCSRNYKIVFPKVVIGIPTNRIPDFIEEISTNHASKPGKYLTFGSEEHLLLPDEYGRYMYKIITKEKIHEMTIDEIEKELGYKIKIVSNE